MYDCCDNRVYHSQVYDELALFGHLEMDELPEALDTMNLNKDVIDKDIKADCVKCGKNVPITRYINLKPTGNILCVSLLR